MTEKKLFPGVTKQDIQRQEVEKKAAEQAVKEKQAAIQAAKKKAEKEAKAKEEQKQFEDTIQDFYKKFGNKVGDLKHSLHKFVFTQLAFLGVAYGIWLFGHVEPGKDAYGDDKGINLAELALSKSDFEAADETLEKTGSKTLAFTRYFINPTLETYNLSNIFKKESYDTNKYGWRATRAYVGLLIIIFAAISSIAEISGTKKQKISDIRKLLILWQKNNIENIKMEEFINKDIVGKIISHMSGQNATIFHQILSGEKTVSYETAVKIMEGHLKSHTEDLQMIFDFFDERSIPESIKQMANTQAR